MVIDPEVAQRGFARAGLKTSHRRFIDFDIVGPAQTTGECLIEWQQAIGEVIVPGAHEVAGQINAVRGLELPLLAVKGAVVAELLGEEMSAERRSEHAAEKKAWIEWRGDGNGIHFVFADMREALDNLKGEGSGFDVKALAGFLSKKAEVIGCGEHVGVYDFAHNGGQALERLAQLAGTLSAWLGEVSHRSLVCGSGGGWLFCLFVEELHEELVVIELLAAWTVDAFEESGDKAFLNGQFGLQRSDLRREFFDLLFGRLDVYLTSKTHAMIG